MDKLLLYLRSIVGNSMLAGFAIVGSLMVIIGLIIYGLFIIYQKNRRPPYDYDAQFVEGKKDQLLRWLGKFSFIPRIKAGMLALNGKWKLGLGSLTFLFFGIWGGLKKVSAFSLPHPHLPHFSLKSTGHFIGENVTYFLIASAWITTIVAVWWKKVSFINVIAAAILGVIIFLLIYFILRKKKDAAATIAAASPTSPKVAKGFKVWFNQIWDGAKKAKSKFDGWLTSLSAGAVKIKDSCYNFLKSKLSKKKAPAAPITTEPVTAFTAAEAATPPIKPVVTEEPIVTPVASPAVASVKSKTKNPWQWAFLGLVVVVLITIVYDKTSFFKSEVALKAEVVREGNVIYPQNLKSGEPVNFRFVLGSKEAIKFNLDSCEVVIVVPPKGYEYYPGENEPAEGEWINSGNVDMSGVGSKTYWVRNINDEWWEIKGQFISKSKNI